MSPASELSPGAAFGGYRIERVIGRGGMGIVYLARQATLERPVALKVIAPQLADSEDFRARFRREWMLAAAIEHPNIIPVYEAGEIDGTPFIAMRYVPGPDLGALIEQRGPVKTAIVRQVVEEIGLALDAAHGAGLVHRDVKPANVLLAGVDDEGPGPLQVYLTDFGLTRGRGESKLTQTGTWVGTVSYISPEQIEGTAVDGRSDLYSLACVAFEALTARPPFTRENDVATLYAHMQDERPRASQLRPGLPPAVDAVIARGMARLPADRYGSGRELGDALAAALAQPGAATVVGAPTPPLPRPLPAPAVASAGRGRPSWLVPALAGAAAIAVLVAGLALAGVLGGGSSNEASGSTSAPATTAAPPTTASTAASVTTATTSPPTAATVTAPTSTPTTPAVQDREPLVVPALALSYQSAAGPVVRYPASWRVRNFARRDTSGETFFEYVNVASGPFSKAPMYARVVFGSPGDFGFFETPQQLVGRARTSARAGFRWKTAFGGAFPITISGQPGQAVNFVWTVSKRYHGFGFVFGARNPGARRWIYGWAAFDDWDQALRKPGRVEIRRKTLIKVVGSIRW